MAGYGWGKNRSVGEWLDDEPHGFDFFQAVRLLELDSPDCDPVGEGPEPAREAVRFRSSIGLDFPTSDVAEVKRADGQRGPAHMTVNIMGIAGATGPLDAPLTEHVIERDFRGDKAPRDFLDIFNHRLVSLLYRTRKLHRVGLATAEPGEDQIASYLYAVIGLGTEELSGRMQVKDRSLLQYAGLIAQQPRSMAGLEAIVSGHFGVEVVGVPFRGRWYALEESQWTVIDSKGGQNASLGVDTVVGTRVWDEQAAFELQLGPLTLEQFEDFLPTGWAFRPLCDLVRFYAGDELDFSFRLKLKASEVPSAWLPPRHDPRDHGDTGDTERQRPGPGFARGARLGWTSRLHAEEGRGGGMEVVVSPESLMALMATLRVPNLRVPVEKLIEFRAALDVWRFGLPPEALQDLLNMTEQKRFAAGDEVYQQGTEAVVMYVVLSGSVRLERRGEDGVVRNVSTLGPGEYLGADDLITGKFRSATAVALEDCELLELSEQDLTGFARRHPRFAAAIDTYARARTTERKRRRLMRAGLIKGRMPTARG